MNLTNMELTKLIHDFNNSVDHWIMELNQYNLKDLMRKPATNSWSLGQVYCHIILETTFFLQQVRICASTTENSTEEASAEAKAMFKENAFPDIALQGPPSNNNVPQPDSIEDLREQLLSLKIEARLLVSLLQSEQSTGKTRHPGLNYFGATEWLQFAEMHLRHHFRQKARIDDFLKT